MTARTRTRPNQNTETEVNETETQNVETPEVEETEIVVTPDETIETDETLEQPTTETKPTPTSPVTPFQAAKRVNAALKAAGVDRKIQAPMLYTYAAKGYFVTRTATKVTKKGDTKEVIEVDEESFFAWMEKYVAGAIERATGVKQLQQVVDDEAAKVEIDEGAETEEVEGELVEAE